jgi:phage terminase small subunit
MKLELDKRKLFVEARLQGKTPEDAALDAGYPPHAAALAGAQLMGDAEILQMLANHKPAEIEIPSGLPAPLPSPEGDPMRMLESVMNNTNVDLVKRMEAAKTLMPFKYAKLGETGKKEGQQRNAEKVGATGNKFAPTKAPSHLKTVK